MRVPNDIPLASYIRRLIKSGRIEQFYKSDDWIELRQSVLDDLHYECQECLKKGEYSRADCVHHVNEVRHRPDLALSRYYTDQDGNRQSNLVPLCNKCHSMVHDKAGQMRKNSKTFFNEERW